MGFWVKTIQNCVKILKKLKTLIFLKPWTPNQKYHIQNAKFYKFPILSSIYSHLNDLKSPTYIKKHLNLYHKFTLRFHHPSLSKIIIWREFHEHHEAKITETVIKKSLPPSLKHKKHKMSKFLRHQERKKSFHSVIFPTFNLQSLHEPF
jgi:hypothetical protein